MTNRQMVKKASVASDFRVLAGRLSVFFMLAAICAGQAIASTAGVFQFVVGDVRLVLAAGSERPARKGSPVSVGDTIATARASVAQIKMGDGAIVVVQPESRLTVAEFHYTGKVDGSEKVRFRLEHGGIRSVTGAIGHSHADRYLIETPIAHIGVRGTDHEAYHFPASGSGKEATAQAGTYDKVNVGLTYIRTQGGEVVIRPNQVGYAASAQDTPRLLPAIPEFFNRAIEPRSAQRGGSGSASDVQVAAGRSAAPAQQVTRPVLTESGVNLTSGSSSSSDGTGGNPGNTTDTTFSATASSTPGTPTGTTTGTTTTGTTTGTTPGTTTTGTTTGMTTGTATGTTTGTTLTGLSGTAVGYTTPQGSSGGNGLSGVNLSVAANGATLVSTGGDAAWGVSWGSWQGGLTLVDGGATKGATHFIESTNLTSAAQLAAMPSSLVSANYSYAGGPAPTDHSGNQGAINSLTVGVNFSTQTISSYAVNATVGATNWTGNGSGSIASFTGAGINLSGNCTGCSGGGSPTTKGTANGAFVGAAAERMITSFGLNKGNQAIAGAAYLSR